MSRKRLLSTLNKSERNFKNILLNGFERIAKMLNLSQNELEQITKIRHIKNDKKLSKEGLLIALLKSEEKPCRTL